MNNLYLKYCFQQQIPLPEVFQYLSKKNTTNWESENPAKQQALKSYLMLCTLNFHLRSDFTDHEEFYDKPTLFKGLVNVISDKQQSVGDRLKSFIKHYEKLIRLFKEWHDDDIIAIMIQIKNSFEITLPKRKYFKILNRGEKNIILQVLQSCIIKEDPVIEVLYALKIYGSSFELVQDDKLIYALQQKTPCLLFNEKKGLNEQNIILEMVKIISKNKNMFVNELLAINSQQLLKTQDRELLQHLRLIFQQSLLQNIKQEEKQIQLQLKQAEIPKENLINLRQDITRKLFYIYIQQAFENKLPIPEIILSIQFKQQKNHLFLVTSKEFLFQMNKIKSFQIFNKQLYLQEFIFYWCNSITELLWLKIYLDEKFPLKQGAPLQQRPQDIHENLQQSYNQRHYLRDRIIEVFNYRKVQLLIKQFASKISLFKGQNIEIGGLIIKFQEFAKQEMQHVVKNENINRIDGLKKLINTKLFTKPIQKTKKKQIEESIKNFMKFLVSIRYPVAELLRYYKLNKYSCGYFRLDITLELFQYFEENTEIQGLISKYLPKNDRESTAPISILDFRLESQNIDEVYLTRIGMYN